MSVYFNQFNILSCEKGLLVCETNSKGPTKTKEHLLLVEVWAVLEIVTTVELSLEQFEQATTCIDDFVLQN